MSNTAEILKKLDEDLEAFRTSEQLQRYLQVQAKFHNYSSRNQFLIYCQMPDARRIAGYNKWVELNRQVRTGEHAIKILAPIITKIDTKTDSKIDTKTSDSKMGDFKTAEKRLVGFRTVNVFDVSQTEGEELPEVLHLLTGDEYRGYIDAFEGIAKTLGFTVEYENIGETNGSMNPITKTITINSNRDDNQKVKTWAHELGHAILHGDVENVAAIQTDRALKELEAESVAYVVCQSIGMDSGDYSFGYLTVWGMRAETKDKSKFLESVNKGSGKIIEMLEEGKK